MAEKKSPIALIFAIAAVTFMVGAFASPYWVESFSKSENRFVKAGLWEFCFNDYTFWKDYNGKRYLGCWYIFSNQYRPIWEWLSPPWFIVCQVMVSVCLLFHVIATFILILMILNLIPQYLKEVVLMGIGFVYLFVVLFGLIEMILFGVKKEDRGWMPRPDQNYLSWGYGSFVICIIFTLISALLLLMAGRNVRNELKEDYPHKNYYS